MRGFRLGLALLSIMLLAGTVTAASYSLSVTTDASTYTGAASIRIAGQVTPAPGPNTAVLIRIFNPNNIIVTADERPVNGTTGLYTDTIVAGGSSNWINGNYKINASWGAFGPTIYSVTTFLWSGTATTTTSTTTSTTSSTSTSTSSIATTTSSPTTSTTSTSSSSIIPPTTSPSTSSSTSSGGGGGIPEFPFQYVTVAVFTILVVASYLVIGRGRKLGPSSHY